MINKSKLTVLSIVALLLVSLSIGYVAAADQYTTQKTTQFTLNNDGVSTATEQALGITYEVKGVAGASGLVTAATYSGNPQPTAYVPTDISLNKFTVITFDMNANDFTSATITFKYTDDDIQNLQAPYTIYKYLPDIDTFVKMPTIVDTEAKTMTIILTSIDDPLFAIGGTTVVNDTSSTSMWIIIAVVAIVIALVAVFLIVRMRNSGRN